VQEIFEAIRAHAGVDVNIRDGADRTPLAATALKGQVKMMQVLLARDDVDRDPVDGDGNTLMHLALLSGKQSMVDFLLATRGTDFLRTRNRERQTPLALAVELEYWDIVRSMLNIVGGSARDSLILDAVASGKETLKLLLDQNPEVPMNSTSRIHGDWDKAASAKALKRGLDNLPKYLETEGLTAPLSGKVDE
jgi:ankyrin repeat protein